MKTYLHMTIVVDHQMNETCAYASTEPQSHVGWWQSNRHLVRTLPGTNKLVHSALWLTLVRMGPPVFNRYVQIETVFRGTW